MQRVSELREQFCSACWEQETQESVEPEISILGGCHGKKSKVQEEIVYCINIFVSSKELDGEMLKSILTALMTTESFQSFTLVGDLDVGKVYSLIAAFCDFCSVKVWRLLAKISCSFPYILVTWCVDEYGTSDAEKTYRILFLLMISDILIYCYIVAPKSESK